MSAAPGRTASRRGSERASGGDADTERDEAGVDAGALRGLGARDLGVRFAFGFAIAVAAGIVTKVAGVHAGGMLLAFPAILPAALSLIEKRQGTSAAVSDTRGAVAGSVGMVAFALMVVALVGRMPAALAIGVALVGWVVVATTLYFGAVALAPAVGEQQYLPDVPVAEVEPVGAALRRAQLTVAVAESCTGGSFAALLTAVPRASEFVRGGVVAYTDDVKRDLLDVPATILDTCGAVSAETARAMADGVRMRLGADVGVGITGLLGRAAEGKPPGMVFVAVTRQGASTVTRIEAARGPESGRTEAIKAAAAGCLSIAGEDGC